MENEGRDYYLVHKNWNSLVYRVLNAELVNGLIEFQGEYHAKAQSFPHYSKLIILEKKLQEFDYYQTLEEAYESHSNKR